MIRPHRNSTPARKGVVLLSTMVVLVLLSLTAYHFSDAALEDVKSAYGTQRQLQAKALADSGIHYAMAWLANNYASSPDQGTSNPFSQPEQFEKIMVPGQNGLNGWFSLIAPVDPGQSPGTPASLNDNRFGFTDETGKINPNSFLMMASQNPKSLTVLANMLLYLPNINQNSMIANSIVDWLDYDSTPLADGMETYSGYNPRNGPLDSIEELALVQGVTPLILYGNDRNRNGRFDAGDDDSAGRSDVPGLWDYMTVYSRELLATPQGTPMTWLNDTPTNLKASNIVTVPGLGQEMVNFILLARQYGVQATGTASSTKGGTQTSSTQTKQGNLSSPPDTDLKLDGTFNNNITSIWQLVDAQVTVPGQAAPPTQGGGGNMPAAGGGGQPASTPRGMTMNIGPDGRVVSTTTTTTGGGSTPSTVYVSPLKSTGDPTLLDQMFLFTTTWPSSSGTTSSTGSGGTSPSGSNASPNTGTTPNSSSSSGSTSQNSWTGPAITLPTYERPARININTCHPDVLNALFIALSLDSSNSGGTSTAGTASTNSSASLSSLPSYVAQILQVRPPLGISGAVDPSFQTPAWLLTKVNMPASLLAQIDPYITTTSRVFRVQSVGVVDGPTPITARTEAVIDITGGLPRIVVWRDLTEMGKGVETNK